MTNPTVLPTDSQERKGIPLFSGLLAYFPAALAEVARVSQAGNDKHNPGEPLHHARGKSMDHADCAVRHLVEHGKIDEAWGALKIRHTAEAAWRILALLQEEMEREGAPLARGARLPEEGEHLHRSEAQPDVSNLAVGSDRFATKKWSHHQYCPRSPMGWLCERDSDETNKPHSAFVGRDEQTDWDDDGTILF